jgi:hypothetical protein
LPAPEIEIGADIERMIGIERERRVVFHDNALATVMSPAPEVWLPEPEAAPDVVCSSTLVPPLERAVDGRGGVESMVRSSGSTFHWPPWPAVMWPEMLPSRRRFRCWPPPVAPAAFNVPVVVSVPLPASR